MNQNISAHADGRIDGHKAEKRKVRANTRAETGVDPTNLEMQKPLSNT